jgi:hypothetical protein
VISTLNQSPLSYGVLWSCFGIFWVPFCNSLLCLCFALEEVSVPFGCLDLDSKEFTEGFSLALEFEVGSDFGVSALGAAVLVERLHFSLPVMLECGAPIYPPESKSVLRYHRRLKATTAQMDTSLFDEVVTALSASTMPFLGTSSQALCGTVVQSSPKLGGGTG